MSYFVFCCWYLYVISCRSKISVGRETANLSAVVIMSFLFGEVSSSSVCLGWAVLFYCCTP